ncbi:MAG: hypothetical protein HY721_21820 [Planctomycetes bacterium]|nr:hypothetical protein [Planctomycetota bacterium]
MWRLRYVLVALVLVPARARGQVDVALLERDPEVELRSHVLALERSRQALLEAREAVDAALAEVDQTLAVLRASSLRPGRRSLAARPAEPRARRGSWLRVLLPPSLEDTLERLGMAVTRELEGARPLIADLREAACRRAAAELAPAGLAGLAPAIAPSPAAQPEAIPARLTALEAAPAVPDAGPAARVPPPEESPSTSTREAVTERLALDAAPDVPAPPPESAPEPEAPTLPGAGDAAIPAAAPAEEDAAGDPGKP